MEVVVRWTAFRTLFNPNFEQNRKAIPSDWKGWNLTGIEGAATGIKFQADSIENKLRS